MNNVAISVESDKIYREVIEASRRGAKTTVADAIVSAAREIAETTDIKAICCFTQSGTTVSLVARERPRTPIIALTPLVRTARRLTLTWGTHCTITEPQGRFKGRRAGGCPCGAQRWVCPSVRADCCDRRRAVQRARHHEYSACGPL